MRRIFFVLVTFVGADPGTLEWEYMLLTFFYALLSLSLITFCINMYKKDRGKNEGDLLYTEESIVKAVKRGFVLSFVAFVLILVHGI